MPAPVKGNLSTEEYEKLYGPETAYYDMLTRDEFYDSMEANGWDREGDLEIIAAVYKVIAGSEGAYNEIYGASGKTEKDRNDLYNGAMRWAKDVPELQEEYKLFSQKAIPPEEMEARLKEEARQREVEKLRAEGAKHDEELAARKRAQEEWEREQREIEAENQRREEQRKREREEREAREAKEKAEREAREAKEKAEREVREAEKRKLEAQLQKEEAERKAREAEKARRKQAQEGLKDMMEDVRVSEESKEKWDSDERYVREKSQFARDLVKRALELGLDKVKLMDGVEAGWASGVDPNLPAEELFRQENEWEKNNPEKASRSNKIQASYNLLSEILRVLKDPENADFVKAARRGDFYEYVPVKLHTLTRLYEADEFTRRNSANALEKLGRMKLKTGGELLNAKNMEDPFWDTMSEKTMSEEQAKTLKNKLKKLSENGFPFEEYTKTLSYGEFKRKSHMSGRGPLETVSQMLKEPENEEKLRWLYSKEEAEDLLQYMDKLEKRFEKNPKTICDEDTEGISIWLNGQGYDLLNNSLLFAGAQLEQNGDQPSLRISMKDSLDDDLDRDILDPKTYQQSRESIRQLQQMFAENQTFFENTFGLMYDRKHSNVGLVLRESDKELKRLEKNPDAMRKLNDFRSLVFKTQEIGKAEAGLCKLMGKNNTVPQLVKPLPEDADLSNPEVRKQEAELLKTCCDMLKEAGTHVKLNSKEYENVMKSLEKAQKAMSGDAPDKEAARKAYVKAVSTTLDHINKYRLHKVKDGLNREDGTGIKMIALERVDKLLRTRYRSVEQAEYESNLGDLADLFKTDVPPEVAGDEYVKQKAFAKIDNMSKALKDYAVDMKKAGLHKSKDPDLLLKRNLKLEEPENVIRRRNSFGGADMHRKPLLGEEAIAQKELDKAKVRLKKSTDKETAIRAKLDVNDEFDREKLLRSAEKSLYLESLSAGAAARNNQQQQAEQLDSKVADYEKNGVVRYRAFKFEHLMKDKDFLKEFDDNVVKGFTEKGQVTQSDIRKFRDDALRKCYTQYKGKDTASLDQLSGTLGSAVNSRSLEMEKKNAGPGVGK